jgi:hypothetical protein
MADYFDPTNDNDLALLPPDVRKNRDLARVAGEAEADVLRVYTEEISPASYLYRGAMQLGYVHIRNGRRIYVALDNRLAVFLDGYTLDADACTNARFKGALKRAIAAAIVWKLEMSGRKPAVRSESGLGGTGSGTAVTYSGDSGAPLPPNALRWLRDYDTRDACYVI